LTGSVRFWFYKFYTEKNQIEPNLEKHEKKLSQTKKTKPNRFESVFVLKNRTETGRFEQVLIFF